MMTATITNEFLRSKLDNIERAEDIDNLIGELKYSNLLMPIKEEGAPLIQIGNQNFIPIFTDIHEFRKVGLKDDLEVIPFDFNFYLELLKEGSPDFLINLESERFPISRNFLELMDTDYTFDLDYQPFTAKEIKRIYSSIDNRELNEFLKSPENRWDTASLMELLLKSDLLTVVGSSKELKEFEDDGIVLAEGVQSYCHTHDRFAVIFSDSSKIHPPKGGAHFYSQLVNLPLFIDHVLKSDLAGLKLDGEIVISREFLIDYMDDFRCPCIDKYDDYLFPIE